VTKKQSKTLGVICLFFCAFCIFVAVERYNANANSVEAINAFRQNSLFADQTSVGELKPAMPAETKYAIFFAGVAGAVGIGLLVKGIAGGNEPPE